MKKILGKVMDIYKMDVFKRSAIIWVAFQVILWVTFYISYLFNVDSWSSRKMERKRYGEMVRRNG